MNFPDACATQTLSPGTKPHYPILDGLRGVASVMVVAFHLVELHSNRFNQLINHGYLAVDFFFLLSGFVIGYAYDDRWGHMSMRGFFKRRLIRLHPMIVMGMMLGASSFYFQASGSWLKFSELPLGRLLMVMAIGFTLLPVPPSMDFRGWREMHPLDGPAWSLFFEYIANILYGLFIKQFSKKALSVLVFLAGGALFHYVVMGPRGDVIGGWAITPGELRVGFTRLIYPFFAGLLLSRVGKLIQVKHAFLLCSLMIITVLSMPRIGGSEHVWMNGLYEALAIIFIFPLIVFLGASGGVMSDHSSRICKFFGDISYPLYITHYPLVYIYAAWVMNKKVSLRDGLPVASLVLVSSIVVAYACLKLYDEPVRRWLSKRGQAQS